MTDYNAEPALKALQELVGALPAKRRDALVQLLRVVVRSVVRSVARDAVAAEHAKGKADLDGLQERSAAKILDLDDQVGGLEVRNQSLSRANGELRERLDHANDLLRAWRDWADTQAAFRESEKRHAIAAAAQRLLADREQEGLGVRTAKHFVGQK